MVSLRSEVSSIQLLVESWRESFIRLKTSVGIFCPSICFFRCVNGEVSGFHAVLLAASSPLLRTIPEDTSRGGSPLELLILDFTLEEVDNLLDLLYSGTTKKTPTLWVLMKMFLINMKIKDSNEDHEDYKYIWILTKEENQLRIQDGFLKSYEGPCFDSDEEGEVNIKKEKCNQPGFTYSDTKINKKQLKEYGKPSYQKNVSSKSI